MTVVVAVVENGVTYMGADTESVYGGRKENYARGERKKIKLFSNGLLLGSSGRVRARQILDMEEDFFTFGEEGLTKQWIVNTLIPFLRKKFKQEYFDLNSDDDNDSPIDLILAWKDIVYVVDQSFSVFRITDCCARGCGKDYAFASLLCKDKSPEERVMNALKMSAKLSSGVGAPFILVNTREYTFEEVQV